MRIKRMIKHRKNHPNQHKSYGEKRDRDWKKLEDDDDDDPLFLFA